MSDEEDVPLGKIKADMELSRPRSPPSDEDVDEEYVASEVSSEADDAIEGDDDDIMMDSGKRRSSECARESDVNGAHRTRCQTVVTHRNT